MGKRSVLFVLALCLSTASGYAKGKPRQQAVSAPGAAINPCTDASHHQFDFWLGSWKLKWPAGQGSPAGAGRNHITSIMDGCVVQEQFDGRPGMALRGSSVSVFVAQAGRWQQTWVDNQGGYLDFVGGMSNGPMILTRDAVAPDGAKIKQRMVWKNIKQNSLDWSWERSSDGGKTWTVVWPIHYTRAGAK